MDHHAKLGPNCQVQPIHRKVYRVRTSYTGYRNPAHPGRQYYGSTNGLVGLWQGGQNWTRSVQNGFGGSLTYLSGTFAAPSRPRPLRAFSEARGEASPHRKTSRKSLESLRIAIHSDLLISLVENS